MLKFILWRKKCLQFILSPSTQEYNPYVTGGGSEEYYMNLIADAMIPYLQSNGIQYVRNTPEMTAGSSLRASNQGNYDLHVAIHSNASGEGQAGQNRGVIIFIIHLVQEGKDLRIFLHRILKIFIQTQNL